MINLAKLGTYSLKKVCISNKTFLRNTALYIIKCTVGLIIAGIGWRAKYHSLLSQISEDWLLVTPCSIWKFLLSLVQDLLPRVRTLKTIIDGPVAHLLRRWLKWMMLKHAGPFTLTIAQFVQDYLFIQSDQSLSTVLLSARALKGPLYMRLCWFSSLLR